ncbi:MAG: hypothetical protein R2867_20745 [Caldilineaceae bacterium]
MATATAAPWIGRRWNWRNGWATQWRPSASWRRDELRPSKHLAELLAQALDVISTQQASLVYFARSTPTLPLERKTPLYEQRCGNLPAQLTPFFGRTAEIIALTQHLTNPTRA